MLQIPRQVQIARLADVFRRASALRAIQGHLINAKGEPSAPCVL